MCDQWGPWIEHDGVNFPPVPLGTLVHRVFDPSFIQSALVIYAICPMHEEERGSWIGTPGELQVIRYRVRKPRGLTILESLLADLPEKVDE